MSANLGKPARLIWSLTGSALGTTLAADGDSGGWDQSNLNAVTPVDLRDVEDVWLTALCTGHSGTTPTLTVSLNVFDDGGNAWQALALAAINTDGVGGGKQASSGLHGGAASSYFVLPSWGQVAWAIGGSASPTFTGVDISLWAR